MYFLQRFEAACVSIFLINSLSKSFVSVEAKLNTTNIIDSYGYPWEEHKVTTSDGYILTMYRIPHPPNDQNNNNSSSNKRPVLFLMHGLGASSSDWVLSGSPQGAAFFFVNAGYDVWLGNARGTHYSREHVSLNRNSLAYWIFSWHEIGIYDLPSCIKYILNVTSVKQIQYIGESQGTTVFFVASSTVPGFNELIKSAHLLGPVAFNSNNLNVAYKAAAPKLGIPNPFVPIFGGFNIQTKNAVPNIFVKVSCGKESVFKLNCSLNSHDSHKYSNMTALELTQQVIVPGASSNQVLHYFQLYNSKKFRQFDFSLYNTYRYNQGTPPDYALQKITTPIYLYYSDGDDLADSKDVESLQKFLQPKTLRKLYKMPFKEWNHRDFIFANNVAELLYAIVLKDIKSA